MEQGRNIQIGTREHWGNQAPIDISPVDLRQHLYIIGKSGTGKTTLLRNLIVQIVESGAGVGVIDPHGDLAEELLDLIPRHRIEEVVYFNPADAEFPVAFNVLKTRGAPHLVASGIVGAFKNIWGDSWGPRLEYILYASVAALGECQNVSLLGIHRMLVDEVYRAWVVKQVDDPFVKSFWNHEFANYDRKFMLEAIAPIQNKVGQLLMSPLSRNVLGQVQCKVDPRFMMDSGRIFIANLAKGRLGEDKSNLLGSFLVSQFEIAAMSRSDVPERERRDFRLFVDEFQSFSSDSFASMLSEARKFRLSLILSHQYIGQISETIRNAVLGNVGSLVSFRVGPTDAEILSKEFGNGFLPKQFTDLGNHEVAAKVLSGGGSSEPVLGRTLRPQGTLSGRRETIMRRSRERYATRRQIVEGKLRKWLGEIER